ncbi:MAG TPA: lysyl oxidase family protein [Streptosporangiaceae bacterium]|nr:lysyl oxidase family protein [Streptosporangiaceae bacterium]
MRRPGAGRAAPVAVASLLALGTVAGTAAAGGTALGATAAARPAAAAGPVLKLERAQASISLPRYGKQVYLDPGIWVDSLGSALRLNVRRTAYGQPLTITQQIATPWGTTRYRRLPHWTLAGWNGLKNFAELTVRNHAGQVVASHKLTFCPDSYDPERTRPNSPARDRFPQQCSAGDPFGLGEVWGITRGWAVDPAESDYNGSSFQVGLGTYKVTETIRPAFAQLFHITTKNATATVTVHVVKPTDGIAAGPRQGPALGAPLPSLPKVATLKRAPRHALPDLVALPSWGISAHNTKKGLSYIDFGATVWVGGQSKLDVEGFRNAGSNTMRAYQYFYRNGHIIGRIRAGTMSFDSEHGHNHWHFQQFARYVLLSANTQVAVRSRKAGFCIAPTDAVNMLLKHADWRPSFLGFGGQCGSPTALWVQEAMPIGWGDTYFQSLAGQSFNISSLPNGTYYIEIIANPEHLLHEVTRSNDVSLRKVIISGTAGHRHIRVPAYRGLDPEG